MPAATRPPRLCRTVEEIDAAAAEDAKTDPPLSPAQIARLTVLWRPYLRHDHAA